jgi:predicted transcriptional regulator of viral defense system
MPASLDAFIDEQLVRGRAYFSRTEALAALAQKPAAFAAAATRRIKKSRLANPRHGFFLILRPEDQAAGAPGPTRWIDPLMKYQGIDYRVSLLRAAAFHGSTHQAATTFQVVAPQQVRGFEMGKHRLEFLYQAPGAFAQTNQPELLAHIQSETGVAKVAGAELTLLDCLRYFHRASGLSGVAQIVKDIGAQVDPRRLAKVASAYENSVVRRLGFLLEHVGHARQSKVLEPFVRQAKTAVLLDPTVKPLFGTQRPSYEKNSKWKLEINEPVEIDS